MGGYNTGTERGGGYRERVHDPPEQQWWPVDAMVGVALAPQKRAICGHGAKGLCCDCSQAAVGIVPFFLGILLGPADNTLATTRSRPRRDGRLAWVWVLLA